ncbi:MAG: hypothetical protein JW754_05490 [Candidatus Aenigmarchaeota archaeon]|nr:hypothetical protein [Candidatus Aenigmarchaeota archaeon]
MKGQFIFEFIVAALMFFMIILFAINYLNINVSDFEGRFYKDEIQSKALWVSEVLTSPTSNITLVDEWPYFNSTKISLFNDTYCGSKVSFDGLKKRLNMERTDDLGKRLLSMRIVMATNATDLSDWRNKIIDCGQKEDELWWESEVQRIGIMDGPGGEIVTMKVFVGEIGG